MCYILGCFGGVEASGNGRLGQMKVTVNISTNFNQKIAKMEKKKHLFGMDARKEVPGTK